MRWRWWARGEDADPHAATRPASHAMPAPIARAEPAWPTLPPVQRSLDAPLAPVAPLDPFIAGLAAHQNPSFLAPLEHAIDPSGPGGLVDGLAATVPGPGPSYAGQAELVVPARPSAQPNTTVQRRVDWSSFATTSDPPSPASDPPSPAPEPVSADAPDEESRPGELAIESGLVERRAGERPLAGH